MGGKDMLLTLLQRQLDLEKIVHLLIVDGLDSKQRERLLQSLQSLHDERPVDAIANPGQNPGEQAAPGAFELFLRSVARAVECDRELSGKLSE